MALGLVQDARDAADMLHGLLEEHQIHHWRASNGWRQAEGKGGWASKRVAALDENNFRQLHAPPALARTRIVLIVLGQALLQRLLQGVC